MINKAITVNALACQLADLEMDKSNCKVLKNGKVIYDGDIMCLRIRYAENMFVYPFATEVVVSFTMNYVNGDYESIIIL